MPICEVCNLVLPDEHAYVEHLQGKRHKRNSNIDNVRKSTENSIFFTGFRKINATNDEVNNFFSSFGEMKSYCFNGNYGFVEYVEKQPVQFLLSRRIYYKKCPVIINKKHGPKRVPTKENDVKTDKDDTWKLSYSKIKDQLEELSTFDDQLKFFLSEVIVSDTEIHTIYDNICSTTLAKFRPSFPKCVVYKFGSTVNGLGFKNCDLDIYMDLGIDSKETEENSSQNTMQIFKIAKKIMYQKNSIFSNIIPIPRAKIPIIKFIHVPSGISCDINFKNSLGLHNSNLIKHLLAYDDRLKPAMLVIKYWAKEFNLTGNGRITNYALAMMFIFYVQQPSIALVPTILQLRENSKPEYSEGWLVNFDKNYEYSNPTNKMSIPELINGFFEFYAKFNYKEMVICPLDGIARPRKSFDNVQELPDYMNRYKEYASTVPPPSPFNSAPMCLQDPNELYFNITSTILQQKLDNLIKQCQLSHAACSQIIQSDDNLYHDLLPKLFTVTDQNIKMKNKKKDIVIVCPNNSYDVNKWHKEVTKCMCEIFENIFRFQVKSAPIELKQQKLEKESDVHSNDQLVTKLTCVGYYSTWQKRSEYRSMINIGKGYRAKEIAITNAVIENQKKKGEEYGKPIINFSCWLVMEPESKNVIVTLEDVESIKPFFSNFVSSIKQKLPNDVRRWMNGAVFNEAK